MWLAPAIKESGTVMFPEAKQWAECARQEPRERRNDCPTEAGFTEMSLALVGHRLHLVGFGHRLTANSPQATNRGESHLWRWRLTWADTSTDASPITATDSHWA
jgi:hypothetical protein